jgi:Tannase and feruloyl esterase
VRTAAALTTAVLLATALSARSSRPASCDSLSSLTLPNTVVTAASSMAAGEFTPPPLPGGATAVYRNLPAFCRVAATLKPSSDSEIKIEVWMPAADWNGKFQAVGNGGWAGVLSYSALGNALRRGYATASTDTGHSGSGGDASFAFNHPEKVIDFGYRAVHEMTVQAKAVVREFYGKPPALAYWNGCSTGGRQGLKEAQRYPDDYDGIIAGAPANYMTHLSAQSLWVAQAVAKTPGSAIPREKFAALHKAVMEACDALDGIKDGVLEDPRRCQFDPKAIQCTGEDGPECLTAPQVEAARKIYEAPTNPNTKAEIFPGLERSTEPLWGGLAGPNPLSISVDHYKYLVFKNPAWDFKALDFGKDVDLADRLDGGVINAIDPNLMPFFARGGKLLLYHGWIDQLIAPRNTINYYQSVAGTLGGVDAIADSMRLFMVPGMAHCSGGPGPNVFDSIGAIEQWVEQKKRPEQMVASHQTNGNVDRTRPLCPYPQVATYNGSGSTDDAASFTCKVR